MLLHQEVLAGVGNVFKSEVCFVTGINPSAKSPRSPPIKSRPAERACQKVLRRMGSCPGGFFATAFQLDHLGEAMPGDTLMAEVRLFEVGTTFCSFDLTLANQSHGGAKIATGRARYSLFTSAAEDCQPKLLPEWLLPTLLEETL